ncbi:glycerol-3-phosphate dehydrogenase [Candidatus Phytoplasma phoenicium]|uniref:Glycerol-3-phosphate dehydrogenase n=1 Tax=Candidatus Phytoplasma phoenicium TaxID=198422 RepID=A0A2S8NV94_9MOLU|nr:glycerol-3-phosphate dehydrogenase [Candidatus Phytoplasma phoenicium]
MKKITIMGGGSWGSTLGQVLTDNHNKVLIYDINKNYIDKINNQQHPIFPKINLYNIMATNDLQQAINFSDIWVLCLPTQKIRIFLKQINTLFSTKKNFINVSKGIEQQSLQTISQIVQNEIDVYKINNYACLMGPTHAEEVILRKISFLLSVSNNPKFALQISKLFSNNQYLKVSCYNDVIGCEICSAFKNCLSFISGLIFEPLNFGKNAQAAFITLGIKEMETILNFFQTQKQTAFSLAGLGDLIVTAFNENSRNFQAGQKMRKGQTLEQIYQKASQTIEGIYNLKAFYHLSIENHLNLPLINNAYQVIFQQKPIENIIKNLLVF